MLKEPLFHFVLLGALIFAVHGLVSQRDVAEPGEIVITQGHVEHLATGFAKTWQRPPTASEMAGLVRDRVREEVYYREAMALGLDRDDTVIRRRLRQKMEFVSDDIAAQTEPTEAELKAYLQEHPEAYRLEPSFTFHQVHLSPHERQENLGRDVEEVLAALKRGADASMLSDSVLLEHQFVAMSGGDVERKFGDTFAAKLAQCTPGDWQGPIPSGYGVHLVFVSELTEGGAPALEEVRDSVRRDWENTRRLAANEDFYQELLKRYTVTIEGLELEPSTHVAGAR